MHTRSDRFVGDTNWYVPSPHSGFHARHTNPALKLPGRHGTQTVLDDAVQLPLTGSWPGVQAAVHGSQSSALAAVE